MRHFVCPDSENCGVRFLHISNPYQCPRCGAQMRNPATDLPSALFGLRDLTPLGKQVLKRDFERGMISLERRLAAEAEMDRYGGSSEENEDRA